MNIDTVISIIKRIRFKQILYLIDIRLFKSYFTYQRWLKTNNDDFFVSDIDNISIIILDGEKKQLDKTLKSINNSTYKFYEVLVQKNIDIRAIKNPYCIFINAGDKLHKNALSKLINNKSDLVYSDHDFYNFFGRFSPWFKPNFSIEYYKSLPYIHRAIMFNTSKLVDVDTDNLDSFIYSNILNGYANKYQINHVSDVLFHFISTIDLNELYPVLLKYIDQSKTKVTLVDNHFELEYINTAPVSIIIPNKDQKEMLNKCIDSILKYTIDIQYEIIIVENNSVTEGIFTYYSKLEEFENIKVVHYKDVFNYSKINNFGIKHAKYDQILFLNNDIEITQSNWLNRMSGDLNQENVGAVGCQLLYPNQLIQHGGVLIGNYNFAAHLFLQQNKNYHGYMERAKVKQNLSAVTAACLLCKKDVFELVNGFDENLAVAFNDIDLCLKIRDEGYLIVYNPTVSLIHHESVSRGKDVDGLKKQRYERELDIIKGKWNNYIDPYYNVNLSLERTDMAIRRLKND